MVDEKRPPGYRLKGRGHIDWRTTQGTSVKYSGSKGGPKQWFSFLLSVGLAQNLLCCADSVFRSVVP